MKRITLLLALAMAALLAAGCGGMTKAEYEKKVDAIGTKVSKKMDAFDSGTPDEKAIDEGVQALEDAADELDKLDPPSEVSDLHDDLVAGVRDLAKSFEKMAPIMSEAMKAMEDPSKVDQDKMMEMQKDMEKIQSDVEKAVKDLEKVEAGFKKKKYDIGLDT